jgi:hypothetical protein
MRKEEIKEVLPHIIEVLLILGFVWMLESIWDFSTAFQGLAIILFFKSVRSSLRKDKIKEITKENELLKGRLSLYESTDEDPSKLTD